MNGVPIGLLLALTYTTVSVTPSVTVPISLTIFSGSKIETILGSDRIETVQSGTKTDEIQSGDLGTTITSSNKEVSL